MSAGVGRLPVVALPAGTRAPEPALSMPDLVLLHAYPLRGQMFDGLAAELGPGRVLVPELLHGAPLRAEPSMDVLADAVVATMDAHDMAAAVVAGVSMGGYVALALRRRHPDRVLALALLDSRAEADTAEAAAGRERVAQTVLADRGTAALLGSVDGLLGETSRRERPDLLARVRSWALGAPFEAVAWCQRAMAARADSLDVLAGLDVPALVLVGEEDTVTPPELAVRAAHAIPAGLASHVVVDRAGHLAALERPDVVAGAMRDLLGRVAE